MAHLLKVALPGFDVKTATPEQCAVHSGFSAPKIDATKEHFTTFQVFFVNEPPDPAIGSTLETILHATPHKYDYQPQTWLHADYISNYGGTTTQQFGPGEALIATPSIGNSAYVGIRVDRNNYYVYIRKESASAGIPVIGMSINLRLYIFADTAFS